MLRDASDLAGGVVEPLLAQQERLIDQAEGRMAPFRIEKTPILGQGVDTGRHLVPFTRDLDRVEQEAHGLAHGFLGQFLLLARRQRHVQRPVEIGKADAGRRYAEGQAAQHGLQQPVQAAWRKPGFGHR